MKQLLTSRFAVTAGFFAYLVGYVLLCIALLLWAVVERSGRAMFAKAAPTPGSGAVKGEVIVDDDEMPQR